MQTRIYVVEYPSAQGVVRRLVDATSAAAAIKHCVAETHAAKIAAPKALASLMGEGIRVEKSEPTSLPSQAV